MKINSVFNRSLWAFSRHLDVVDDTIPNGWGKQTYSGEFWDKMRVYRVNTNNILQKKGWILAHAAKHFSSMPIKLVRKANNYQPSQHRVLYKPQNSSDKASGE